MRERALHTLMPNFRVYFAVMVLFAGAAYYFNFFLGLGQTLITLAVYFAFLRAGARKRKEVVRYLDSVTAQMDHSAGGSLLRFPLPMAVIRPAGGEILWANEPFSRMIGISGRFEKEIGAVVPGLSTRWLAERKDRHPQPVQLRDSFFTVYGTLLPARGAHPYSQDEEARLAALYFIDCTEELTSRQELTGSKPVAAVVLIDNYEELMKDAIDSEKSNLVAAIDKRVVEWASPAKGLLRKYDRDKYLFVCETRHMTMLADAKYSLLDAVRELKNHVGVVATVSIGIGHDAPTLEENLGFAQLSIDMALSRGGDQVVLKSPTQFQFFGGRNKEMQRRTKVKARVVANSLSQLISSSSMVMVMGHKAADLDSLGAAAGVICAARTRGCPAYIVVNPSTCAAANLLDALSALPEYQGVFISEQEALLRADRETLLVVVDTNRPDYAESPALLDACHRVAVIDHHRRAAEYIERAALSFHEPYASSSCELVTELLQSMGGGEVLLRAEAEALLSGIVLDTKNFTLRTGVRTFEAAAYLKGAGADPVTVRKLFQNDLASSVSRYEIIHAAQVYKTNMAVAMIRHDVSRVVAAQAADELLNVTGVQASFVLFPEETGGGRPPHIVISARSLGEINVQIILEKIGGGGHLTMAGAQMPDIRPEEAMRRLLTAIDEYAEETGTE
jgi:c-di-AMP phosphodiesterase-like protein